MRNWLIGMVAAVVAVGCMCGHAHAGFFDPPGHDNDGGTEVDVSVDVFSLPSARASNDVDVDNDLLNVQGQQQGQLGFNKTDFRAELEFAPVTNVEAPDVKGAAEEFGKSLERSARFAPDIIGASAPAESPCGDVQGASAGTGPVILGLQTVSIECKAYRLHVLEDQAEGFKVTLAKISFYAAWLPATIIKVATGGILN